MRKVILEPTELHVTREGNRCFLYAGLWHITSSDIQTHDAFCNVASYYGVFHFYNSGRYAKKGEPYTCDDGLSSMQWLYKLVNLIIHLQKNGVQVVIKLDKKSVKDYGISENYDKYYVSSVEDKLIDTYFLFLINLLKQSNLNLDSCLSTRCNKFNSYSTKCADYLYVDLSNAGKNIYGKD